MTSATHSEDATPKRNRRILQASLSAIVCKGCVLLSNAVSIPITVRYLGPEQFGLWVTISTTFALLILLDLGISNVMTNRLSEAYALADKDLAARYATTGLAVMILIALALAALGACIWPFLPWDSLFRLSNASNHQLISQAAAVAYVLFLISLPAGLAARFLGGYQEIRTANIVSAIGACANLLAVILVVKLHGNLITLIAASSGASVATNLGCLVWLWIWHKPWLAPKLRHWQPHLVRPLLSSGGEFFLIQLAGLIVFNSDNLVIAHYLGPQQVTPYAVTWRLVGYAAALQIIMTPALWPAYAEAWIRHDVAWIRRTLRKVIMATMAAAGAACCILLIWGRNLVALWAGPAAVPSQTLISLMCLWILISTFMANTATVLGATNHVKLQARLSMLAAAVNLAASIWLVQRIGSVGVLLGTIGSYLLILVVPQTLQAYRVLHADPPTPAVAS